MQAAVADQLRYPVPCYVPGDRSVRFDVAADGTYQFLALGCKDCSGAIFVDNREILPAWADRKNGLVCYRCSLKTGTHTLCAEAIGAQSLSVTRDFGGDRLSFSVRDLGPYDKVHSMERRTDIHIRVRMKISQHAENWQAGVIFRADHLADGGEGADKFGGTNFFVGYRVCVTEGKIQLWKHRYDETLLQEAPCEAKEYAAFDIRADGNGIVVYYGGSQILSYQDPEPIVCGYVGFHTRNCIQTEGTIS